MHEAGAGVHGTERDDGGKRLTEQEMAVYQLAENLHMTVTEMEEKMTWAEYQNWCRFYAQREEQSTSSGKKNLMAGGEDDLLKGLGL